MLSNKISVNRALKSGRLMRAASGLSAQEFNQLAQSFGQELQKRGVDKICEGSEAGEERKETGRWKDRKFEKFRR